MGWWNAELTIQTPKRKVREWTQEDAKRLKKLRDEDQLTWQYKPSIISISLKFPIADKSANSIIRV